MRIYTELMTEQCAASDGHSDAGYHQLVFSVGDGVFGSEAWSAQVLRAGCAGNAWQSLATPGKAWQRPPAVNDKAWPA